jgi:sialate O-acetylesterase
MAFACGCKAEYIAPLYHDEKFDGAEAIIHFSRVGGGLLAKGSPLTVFAIAGWDKKFVFADAVVEGDNVVASSPSVSAPASVRYSWADNLVPALNLWNTAGLPASPFDFRPDVFGGARAQFELGGWPNRHFIF